MNLNPASLFDFLNTAEMYYSAFLLNLNLYPTLSAYLVGMRVSNMSPNYLLYLVDQDQGEPLDAKLKEYGYPCNLALVNIGSQLFSIAITLIGALLLVPISRIPCPSKLGWFKRKLEGFLKSFKYRFFIRLWLQTFFEFLISCSLGIRHSLYQNPTQIVDFCLCFLILVIFMQFAQIYCLGLFGYLLRKRSRLANEEEIKAFMEKYGTCFEEFKEDGITMWLFYVFGFFFISDGILQLTIAIGFSLTVFII
jgi:hypothetical protein